jgi:GNAT superfamily N-acetyltransferase
VTDRELVRSAAICHVAWLSRGATVRHREPDARWVVRKRDASLLFPRLGGEDLRRVISQFVAAAAEAQVDTAACWATVAGRPPELGDELLARGFETGWRPHWMAIEALPPQQEGLPDGVTIEVEPRPKGRWRATARRDGEFAGIANALLVGDGAGVFDVYTPDEERRRGIGWATTRATLAHAFEAGATHATVNATDMGTQLYAAMGFRSLGYGQTWWLHGPGTLITP